MFDILNFRNQFSNIYIGTLHSIALNLQYSLQNVLPIYFCTMGFFLPWAKFVRALFLLLCVFNWLE